MTDPISTPSVPSPRPPDGKTSRDQTALAALAARPSPASPMGPASVLHDRILVHTSWDTGRKFIDSLPAEHSGLVLRGTDAGFKNALTLRKGGFEGVFLIDPEGYAVAAATEEQPFALPPEQLFGLTVDQLVDRQLTCGAAVALTPTGYLRAGDSDALKAAVAATVDLGRDDVMFSVPIDVAWLTGDHIDVLIAVLRRLQLPKAVFLGGQFDPMKKYKDAVANLRRLVAEAGHVAVLRTDLTGFDAITHGAFAASIGTGGSLRHVIPYGQFARSGKNDQTTSVLYPDLMAFYKGSTLAEVYVNAISPACLCTTCDGRHLDTFRAKSHGPAAHMHGINIWTSWIDEMQQRPTLHDRATWWLNRSIGAIHRNKIVNVQLEQPDALKVPKALDAWATLPAWSYGITPAPAPRSRTQ